jgi:RNase P subunit RPR2
MNSLVDEYSRDVERFQSEVRSALQRKLGKPLTCAVCDCDNLTPVPVYVLTRELMDHIPSDTLLVRVTCDHCGYTHWFNPTHLRLPMP